MEVDTRFQSGILGLLARGRSEDLPQVGIVALTFIIATQYWPIREHVVFFLILLYSIVAFVGSKRTISLEKPRILVLALFLAFLAWLLASTLWSPTPHMSFSYGLLSCLVGVSAVFQGLVLTFRNFAAGIVVGVSFQVGHSAFLLFGSGNEGNSEPWGLYTNPSSLSLVIGIGLAVLPFALRRSWPSFSIGGTILSVFFVFLVDLDILTSFFAVFGAFVSVALIGILRRQRPRAKKVLIGLYMLVIACGAFIFFLFRGPILGLIGEDASMAERVPLWSLYFEAVLWRPVLGSGWGSTVGWDFPLSPDRLSPVAEWFPAHNGYLDIALMLGFVGLGLFLGALASLLFVSLSDATNRRFRFRATLVPVVLVYLMLNDIMATSFPKLLGIYLVGTLVGLVVAKSSATSDDVRDSARS